MLSGEQLTKIKKRCESCTQCGGKGYYSIAGTVSVSSVRCPNCADLRDALEEIAGLREENRKVWKVVEEAYEFREWSRNYWCWPIFGPYKDTPAEDLDKGLAALGYTEK